jgi:hypothetical protein
MVPDRQHGLRAYHLRADDAFWQTLDWPCLRMDHGKYWNGCDDRVSACLLILLRITCLIFLLSAISAYALEKYPEQSTCVSAILNMWRTCGGFAVGYFQPQWIVRNGIGLVFGIQAVIVVVAAVLTITPVLMWEAKRRLQAAQDV